MHFAESYPKPAAALLPHGIWADCLAFPFLPPSCEISARGHLHPPLLSPPLHFPLLTHSVGSSVSIHPPSPTWTTRITWRPAWRLQPLCPPSLPPPPLPPPLSLRKPFVSRELSSIFHAFPRPIPPQPNRARHLQDRQTATCNSQRDGKFIDGN